MEDSPPYFCYNPVRELNDAIRTGDSFEFAGDEAEAVEFVVGLDADPARRKAAIAICRALDTRYRKFADRITDFAAFWTVDNLGQLGRYGTSPFNHINFDARRQDLNGRSFVTIRHGGDELRVLLSPQLTGLVLPEWQTFALKRR